MGAEDFSVSGGTWFTVMISGSVGTQFSSIISDFDGGMGDEDFSVSLGTAF